MMKIAKKIGTILLCKALHFLNNMFLGHDACFLTNPLHIDALQNR